MGVIVLLIAFGVSAVALYGASEFVDDDTPAAASGPGEEIPPGGPVNATVTARNSQFSPRAIRASTNSPVTVTYDNQDAGVLHDIQFFSSRTASGSPLAKTDPFQGVEQRQVNFTAPSSSGNYLFRCSVHPDTMSGTLQVQ
jgi:plastocyanin